MKLLESIKQYLKETMKPNSFGKEVKNLTNRSGNNDQSNYWHFSFTKIIPSPWGMNSLEIDFNLKPDGLLVISGPSGSGKTTIVRCIAGLSKVDRGKIQTSKRDIHLVFQEDSLFPHMTVEKHLDFAGADLDFKEELLRYSGLGTLRKLKPSALSGGQKKRLSLIRGLGCKPKLLILDEVFSSLDEETKNLLLCDLLYWQRILGFAMILVSHDKDMASFLNADQLIIGRTGSITHYPSDKLDESKKYYCFESNSRMESENNTLWMN